MPLQDVEIQLFRIALSRRKEVDSTYLWHAYDPVLDYIYLPDKYDAVSFLTGFFHETQHSALGQSIYGMTLTSISAIEDLIALKLYSNFLYGGIVEPNEQEFWSSTGSERPLYERIEKQWEAHKSFLSKKDRIARIAEQTEFVKLTKALKVIRSRLSRLTSLWRTCQEGYALYSELTVEDEYPKHYYNLAMAFPSQFEGKDISDVYERAIERISVIRNQIRSDDPNIPSYCRKGFNLFEKINNARDCYDDVWIAARLASHFPYYSCDILDMEGEEFDRICESSVLDTERRLEILSDSPEIIPKLPLETSTVQSALEFLMLGELREPVFPESIFFDIWDTTCNLNAEIFKEAFGQSPFEIPKESNQDFRFDLNAGIDTEFPLPPVVKASGEVYAKDEKTREIFIKHYNMNFTTETTLAIITQIELCLNCLF